MTDWLVGWLFATGTPQAERVGRNRGADVVDVGTCALYGYASSVAPSMSIPSQTSCVIESSLLIHPTGFTSTALQQNGVGRPSLVNLSTCGGHIATT
jgi:hypothetical protein